LLAHTFKVVPSWFLGKSGAPCPPVFHVLPALLEPLATDSMTRFQTVIHCARLVYLPHTPAEVVGQFEALR
jgi:hypothetical protein